MKSKLFGQNISPDCAYCSNAIFENEVIYCAKSRRIEKNKCKSFKYDPLMRVPKKAVIKKTYTADNFKI